MTPLRDFIFERPRESSSYPTNVFVDKRDSRDVFKNMFNTSFTTQYEHTARHLLGRRGGRNGYFQKTTDFWKCHAKKYRFK